MHTIKNRIKTLKWFFSGIKADRRSVLLKPGKYSPSLCCVCHQISQPYLSSKASIVLGIRFCFSPVNYKVLRLGLLRIDVAKVQELTRGLARLLA